MFQNFNNNQWQQPYFGNPYQSQQFNNQLNQVTGLDDVKARPVMPNSSTVYFKNDEDIMYIKTTDANNFPTIRSFRFEEISDEGSSKAPIGDFVTKEDLEAFKEEVLTNVKQLIQQSNDSDTNQKQRPAGGTNSNSKQYK